MENLVPEVPPHAGQFERYELGPTLRKPCSRVMTRSTALITPTSGCRLGSLGFPNAPNPPTDRIRSLEYDVHTSLYSSFTMCWAWRFRLKRSTSSRRNRRRPFVVFSAGNLPTRSH